MSTPETAKMPAHPPDLNPLHWHEGNLKMHGLMSIPTRDNPTSAFLNSFRAGYLQICNLFAVGFRDEHGQPWTSLWGGEDGAVGVHDLKTLAIKSLVDRKHDPFVARFLQVKPDKGVCGCGLQISGLGIRLATRDRVKLAGTIMGAVIEDAETESVANASVMLHVDSSLGNCPKYLNIKEITPVVPDPVAHPEPLPLPEPALALLEKADCFFITAGLSTNYRGGPRGFVRVLSNKPDSVQIAYPEYSGNRLYQTLGNLFVEPFAGIVIPDFSTGDALYATCEARILAGPEAAALMPRTNLVIILTIKAAQFIQRSLSFHAVEGDPSPYNPPLRLLAHEAKSDTLIGEPLATAELVDRVVLADDVACLTFQTDKSIAYRIGQHVALNFDQDLGVGYSHMRDDDPSSLNDDLNRSFTVTSTPPTSGQGNHFELVVRNVGRVTKHLIKSNIRGGIRCSVLGFGGSFAMDTAKMAGFLGGGVGITPLLCQIHMLDSSMLQIVWTVNQKDILLVSNLLKRWNLQRVHLYISGVTSDEQEETLSRLKSEGHRVEKRRLNREDLTSLTEISKWYVCAGPALQKSATEWLQGKEIISESFNF